MIRAAAITCAFLSISPTWGPGSAQEWTRFRGPNGQGIGNAAGIPSTWGEADYNWKTALPGAGHSSPVVWGERIFVGSGDEKSGEIVLLCVATQDGRILWRTGFPLPPFHKHNYNTFASGTPAVDDERVYFCGITPSRYLVAGFDHLGKKVWERDLGPYSSQHGPGCSPIVFGDLVIVGNEQDGASFLTALDAGSGETRWKTPRQTVEAAYATPCVYTSAGGQAWLIFSSEAHGISAINPETGTPVWEYSKAFDKRVVSSPVLAGNLILGACGSGGGGNYVIAIRPPMPGRNAEPEVAWTVRRSAPYVPTSVAFGDRVYLWSDGGILSCVDGSSGEVKYSERVGGNYFSSPVIVGDRLFGVSSRGEVVVVATGDIFRVLGRNGLGETMHSTPAVANGCIYFRTVGHLFSLGRGMSKP